MSMLIGLYVSAQSFIVEHDGIQIDLAQSTIAQAVDTTPSTVTTGNTMTGSTESPTSTSTTVSNEIQDIITTTGTVVAQPVDDSWKEVYDEVAEKIVNESGLLQRVATGDELANAINWMYTNGLTMFVTKEQYRPDDFLTREQMAKMIVQAYDVLGYSAKTSDTVCNFSDASIFDPSLAQFVARACSLGIMNGRDNQFHPTTMLTRAQAITLMIRIFEQKKSDETVTPRWRQYITKAQAIGLTTLQNDVLFEENIKRGDVALMFYRFKGLSENAMVRSNALQQMQGVVNRNTTTRINTQVVDDSIGLLAKGISVGNDPELREAVFRLFQQGMTIYRDAEEFRVFDQIERQEAARFIGQFHQRFIKQGDVATDIPLGCYFKDLQDADKDLQAYILYTCTEGIFAGQNGGYFYPTHTLAKSEFIAALLRMLGKTYETEGDTIRREPYYNIAMQLGLVTHLDKVAFVRNYPITRYEVALILYRFRIKYKLLDSLISATLEDQIVSMVENSTRLLGGEKEGKVFINTSRLGDQNFDVGYIEIFDTRYKIVKDSIDKYFANNFVRYGYVYDIITDMPIGTLSFTVSNTTVLEGNIRPQLSGTVYYEIRKPEDTNAYYYIFEKSEQTE